jgi:membrane protein
MAAALAFYFLLSLFPALIVLSAALAFLPGHAIFDRLVNGLTLFVPPNSMRLMRGVLANVITPNRGAYFSLGFVGMIWAASSSLSVSIEALNLAYGVEEDRPFWKTRALAIALAFLIGVLMLTGLGIMIVGPKFGQWLAARIYLSPLFVLLWPYIHWAVAVGFTILGIEALYLLAPNGKRKFRETLPGATLAVATWLVLSYFLGVYFRHFGTFHKTYGTLGGVVALLMWLYWTGFAILIGAELNAQLARERETELNTRRSSPPSNLDVAA